MYTKYEVSMSNHVQGGTDDADTDDANAHDTNDRQSMIV